MGRGLADLVAVLASVPAPLMVGESERNSSGNLTDMVLVWASDEMNQISVTGNLVGIRLSQMFPDEVGKWLTDLDSARSTGGTYRAIRVPKQFKDPGLEIYELSGKWFENFVVFSAVGLVDADPQLRDSIRSAAVMSKTLTMIPISFSIKYADGFLRFPTKQFLENMQLSRADYMSATLMNFVAEPDRAGFTEWFTSPLAKGGTHFIYRALTAGGLERWVEVWRSSLKTNPSPDDSGDMFVIRDIDVLVRLQEANRKLLQQADQQMRLLRDALNSSQDGFAIWDRVIERDGEAEHFRLNFINSVGAKATGRIPKELEGKDLENVLGQANDGTLVELFNTALKTQEAQVRVVEVNSPEGWVGSYENRVFPISVNQVMALFRDISLERREQNHLAWLAEHDHLTGVPNRKAMEKMLEDSLHDVEALHRSIGFVFLDIDFFKRINDDFGHDVGDQVLLRFVKRAKKLIDGDGYFARIAGDEFAIILPNINSPAEIELVLRRVFGGMEMPFMIGEISVSVRCSAGAVFITSSVPAGEVMRMADKAMYQAKHQGRNQFVIA
jgi:diguanylate cyclase (GGDEF)-like protein